MTEKGQPLPYPLDECAGCRDLEQQLAQMTQERDKWNENHRVMCRVEHELRQQLVQVQAARTICDVHQAEFDRLEEQLAQKQQECDEHVENLSRCKGNELAEQLAQAEEEIAFWKLQAVER